jgi:hypothetical protein
LSMLLAQRMQIALTLIGNILTEKRCVAPFHLVNELNLLEGLRTMILDLRFVTGLKEFLTYD